MNYKIKGKTKYAIGDDIIYDDSVNKKYWKGKIVGINITHEIDSKGKASTEMVYVFRGYYTDGSLCTYNYEVKEEDLMTLAEFNEMQKKNNSSYEDYLNWLNKKDWWNKNS